MGFCHSPDTSPRDHLVHGLKGGKRFVSRVGLILPPAVALPSVGPAGTAGTATVAARVMFSDNGLRARRGLGYWRSDIVQMSPPQLSLPPVCLPLKIQSLSL